MCDFVQPVFCKNTLFALQRLYFLAAQNYLQEETISSGGLSFVNYEKFM
jgi:hypothetical protein